MPKRVDHEHIRDSIMKAAIKDVAINGLRNCTTKAVASFSGYNEAYIYRYFDNLDDLLLKAFTRSDDAVFELVRIIYHETADKIRNQNINLKEAAEEGFNRCWDYFMDGEEYATFYFRYYYSVFFRKNAIIHHNELLERMANRIKPLLKDENQAWTLINMVYISAISYAALIYSGNLKDDIPTRKIIFESFHQTGINAFNPEKVKID